MLNRSAIVCFIAALALCACHSLKRYPPYTLRGTWHRVESSDSLEGIARKYGVSSAVIREVNDVDESTLKRRTMVFVPRDRGGIPGKGRRASLPPVEPNAASPTPGSQPDGTAGVTRAKSCGEAGRPCLRWPVEGRVRTRFGKRGDTPHDGIDIEAAKGTRIQAAANGVVIYSGNQIKGYGNLVIIRHDSGLITVYAHNDRNLVEEGDTVDSGEVIGEVGQTGIAKVPHLHFEVRRKEQPSDPLEYLEPRR